jgi:hypothetical protein
MERRIAIAELIIAVGHGASLAEVMATGDLEIEAREAGRGDEDGEGHDHPQQNCPTARAEPHVSFHISPRERSRGSREAASG